MLHHYCASCCPGSAKQSQALYTLNKLGSCLIPRCQTWPFAAWHKGIWRKGETAQTATLPQGSLEPVKKVMWDKMALPRAKSHRKRDGGFWGMQHRGNTSCWRRDVFSKGKEIELCFHFVKKFFRNLFLQFYFLCKHPYTCKCYSKSVHVDMGFNSRHWSPIKSTWRAAFNNVGLLGLLVSTPINSTLL